MRGSNYARDFARKPYFPFSPKYNFEMQEKVQPIATVLRIKRRLNQDHLEVLLVGEGRQKRIKMESATVYKFISSQETKESYGKVYESLQRIPQAKTLDERKRVLSARKLKSAQETRFKIASERRMIEMEKSGFNLVDIEREQDDIDDLTNSMEQMVDSYLEEKKDQKYVYDYYIPDHSLQLSQALDYRAGTLDMKEEQKFLDDEVPDSDVGSSSDSNAEDYYKNDYPDEEEDEDESNVNPYYSEPDSCKQSSSSSDY
jgi:Transcription factor Iwr1